jgi:hypothetical protein
VRVLILGQNHSSVMDNLCLGLKLNGVDAKAFSMEYPVNRYSNYDNICVFFNDKRTKLKTLFAIFRIFKVALQCDQLVVISSFSFGVRFDKYLLRILSGIVFGKHIIFTGNDIRIPKIELEINSFYKFAYFNPGYEGKKWESFESSMKLQNKFSSLGFKVIGNIETAPFIDKEKFGNFKLLHHPALNRISTGRNNEENCQKIKIVHAPTSYFFKGTNFVLEAIRELEKSKIKGFEFEMIVGLNQEEYLAKLMNADILIDQLIVGWYGISALQALQCNVLTIVYLTDEKLKLMPDCPIVNANPNNLADILIDLVARPDLIESIRNKGKTFYQKYHHPQVVGRELIEILSQ